MKSKMKFGEVVKITLRGYKEWWSIDTHIIIVPVCCAVVDGLSPFVGIYLSAIIINELAGTHDAHTGYARVYGTDFCHCFDFS